MKKTSQKQEPPPIVHIKITSPELRRLKKRLVKLSAKMDAFLPKTPGEMSEKELRIMQEHDDLDFKVDQVLGAMLRAKRAALQQQTGHRYHSYPVPGSGELWEFNPVLGGRHI